MPAWKAGGASVPHEFESRSRRLLVFKIYYHILCMSILNRNLPSYGIDFDGVVCATDELASKWVKTECGLDVPSYEIDREPLIALIGQERYDRMCPEVYGELTLDAELIHWAAGSLLTLSHDANLYVVTTRPPERKQIAGQWLADYDLLDLFVDLLGTQDTGIQDDTKLGICQRYGMSAMVDNDPRHLRAEVPDGFKKILLKEGSTGKIEIPEGVILARNWDDVLDALE